MGAGFHRRQHRRVDHPGGLLGQRRDCDYGVESADLCGEIVGGHDMPEVRIRVASGPTRPDHPDTHGAKQFRDRAADPAGPDDQGGGAAGGGRRLVGERAQLDRGIRGDLAVQESGRDGGVTDRADHHVAPGAQPAIDLSPGASGAFSLAAQRAEESDIARLDRLEQEYLAALEESGLEPSRLELEITESTALFAAAPGGMNNMAILAKDAGGDGFAVALVHLVRLVGIFVFVPVVAFFLRR